MGLGTYKFRSQEMKEKEGTFSLGHTRQQLHLQALASYKLKTLINEKGQMVKWGSRVLVWSESQLFYSN